MFKIFSIGTGGSQCAQDERGRWWRRDRTGRYLGRLGAWYVIARRPDSAWYNPLAGNARLPAEPRGLSAPVPFSEVEP